MSIIGEVQVPAKSRTFSPDDVQRVADMLKGEAEGQDGKPAANIGYGSFDTPGAARSAGVTLNRLLRSVGAPHNYAVTTFERDGKTVGVLLNKPARERKASEDGATPAKTTGKGKGK